MRVLLISANTEKINMTVLPLGLALVAAATRRAHHEVRFLDLRAEPAAGASISRAVTEFVPQVIGISVRNVDDQNMASPRFMLDDVRDVVAACRAATTAPIVVGGAGYSIFPEAARRYLDVDVGVCGEGEAVFPAILERFQQGRELADIPGVYLPGTRASVAPHFAEDLDRWPLPDEELWRPADSQDPDVWVPVQTRRGCSFDCSYCSTPGLEGRRLRTRSPEKVARHIARAAEAGFRRFYFVDNTFNLPPSYALRLCGCLAALPVRIHWRAILYPHAISEELVRAMAQSGCVEVALGFESGNLSVLQGMNKRFTPEEVRGVSRALKTHGIRRLGFLLLGGPGETPDSVEESLDFAESLQLEMLKVTVGIRIYPCTPLARIAVDECVVSADDDLLRPRFYIRPGIETCVQESLARRGPPIGSSQPAK